jgi:DNA-binding PadR family transcriptional regulator
MHSLIEQLEGHCPLESGILMARGRVVTDGPIWPPGPYEGLTDSHFALLVLCGSRDTGLSPYDIELLIETGRGGVLGRSPSLIYRQIKVLAERGFLMVEQDVDAPRRRLYHITEDGREAATLWIQRAPLELPATDDSVAFVLIVAAKFVPLEIVWKRLRQLWLQVDERVAELDADERRVRNRRPLTTRERLEHSLTRRLLAAYSDWLDEVRREWNMPDPRDD